MSLIPLRDLPGIGPLEWALSQNGWTEENDAWAEALSVDLFGIIEADTHPWLDDDDAFVIGGEPVEEDADLEQMTAQWEANFAPLSMFRDESDAYWAAHGWDVTDGNGHQLELMRALGRQLICAVNKVHSEATLPVGDEDRASAWAAGLEEQARRFKSGR